MNYTVYIIDWFDSTQYTARVYYDPVRVVDLDFDHLPTKEEIIKEYNNNNYIRNSTYSLPEMDETVRIIHECHSYIFQ